MPGHWSESGNCCDCQDFDHDQDFDQVKVLVARTLTNEKSRFWSTQTVTDQNLDQATLKYLLEQKERINGEKNLNEPMEAGAPAGASLVTGLTGGSTSY